MLSVEFFGVRGSTPSCDPEIIGFGGNTSCVLVSVPDEDPIVLDLGTGLRSLGLNLTAKADIAQSEPMAVTALLTHLHWDHVQGLPFFAPILRDDFEMTIVGPPQVGSGLERAIREFMCPPLFPVSIDALPSQLNFVESTNRTFSVGSATITAFPVPHVGATNGYRIDVGMASVAYLPDHQQPTLDPTVVPEDVVRNCLGVDLLIHDSQYSASEFASRSDWGHCTAEFAVAMAKECKAKRLVLFHHDPSHDDRWIEASVRRAQNIAPEGLTVLGASEGLSVTSGLSSVLTQSGAI